MMLNGYETVCELRWNQKVTCPHCDSPEIPKQGKDQVHEHCQRYQCKTCHRWFDDLTNTIFSERHQELKVWILCLYFMSLNLSNRQIAQELQLNESDAPKMTTQLREGIVAKKPNVHLQGTFECDEAYIVAGHKDILKSLKKKGA